MTTAAKPFLKWAGGKTRLLGEISKRVPKSFGRYFEPFLGGGAVFFHLRPRRAILSDVNPYLIETYRCVAGSVEDVIVSLSNHAKKHSEDHYYAVRDAWNRSLGARGSATRSATFIYLNRACFNGLWRVNSRGDFNVPFGRSSIARIPSPIALRAASNALRAAELLCAHFYDALRPARCGDFVYLDPPYAPLPGRSSFVSYVSGGFGVDDQRELAEVFWDLDRLGCFLLLSNSDVPSIRELYSGFRVERVRCSRPISSKASTRGEVSELLISNFY